jgi:hypothetical protein
MPVADVQERSRLLTEQMLKSGQDPQKARKDIEDALRTNMRRGFHERPEYQIEMGMSLMWLTTTSEAAVKKPDARGFVLEFSDSLLSSQYPGNISIAFSSPGVSRLQSSCAKSSQRYAHYWTEATTEAVIKLCNRLRSQPFKVRA